MPQRWAPGSAGIEIAGTGLIGRRRAEARAASVLICVIVGRIYAGAAGGEVHQHVARRVDREGRVEDADARTDRRAGDLALGGESWRVRIADIDLEPFDLRDAGAGRFDFAHAVDEAVRIGEAGDARVIGVEQQARSLLRHCVVVGTGARSLSPSAIVVVELNELDVEL